MQNKPELYDDCITTPTIQQYLFDVTPSDGQTIFNPPPPTKLIFFKDLHSTFFILLVITTIFHVIFKTNQVYYMYK